MGGTNSETINGLRLHINNGEVHVHDDSKGLKYISDQASFKKDVQDAMYKFSKLKSDGAMRLSGKTGTSLCLVKEGTVTFMFLTDNRSIKGKLKDFLKGC